jgi:Domain of unknown function (DUF3332)
MNLTSRRRFLAGAGTVAAAAAVTGCFGSFAATTSLWRFNKGVSDNKWLQWLVFLGLVIIPIYELFTLGDVLVFNTVEFFTGRNPIGAASVDLGNGRMLALSRDPHDANVVRAEIRTPAAGSDAPSVQVYFIQKTETGFVVMDAGRRVIATTTSRRGLIELLGADGARLLAVDDAAASSMAGAIAQGASPVAVIEAYTRQGGHERAIARARDLAAF